MVPPLTRPRCDVLFDNKEFPLTFVSVHISLSLLFFHLRYNDGMDLGHDHGIGLTEHGWGSMARIRMYF